MHTNITRKFCFEVARFYFCARLNFDSKAILISHSIYHQTFREGNYVERGCNSFRRRHAYWYCPPFYTYHRKSPTRVTQDLIASRIKCSTLENVQVMFAAILYPQLIFLQVLVRNINHFYFKIFKTYSSDSTDKLMIP